MPNLSTTTALAKLLDPLLTLARHHRLEPSQLLADLDLNEQALSKPGARFPAAQFAPLIDALASRTENPLIALRLGEATQPRMLGSTGFLMTTAASLQDAYQVLIDYLPLLYEGAVLQMEQTLDGTWLTLEFNDAARKPTEYFLACLANWPRWLTGHQVPVQRLELTFPMPENPQAYERFFAAEITFDAPHNRLLLSTDYLSLACLDANAEMHQLHREFADSLLSDSAQRSALIAQTRNLIRRQLNEGDGCVRREQVAASVNLSLRTLQRKLGLLGTSFQEIYDQTRREHCLQLIQRGQLSFGEIAFRLGFSNQSAFQKAFKRWMGMAPSQYRAQIKPAALQQPDQLTTEHKAEPRWQDPARAAEEIPQALQQLSEFSYTLMQWAALVDEPIDLNLLAAASHNPVARLAIHLWPAQQQGLIEPLDSTSQRNPTHYRFCHSLIRERLIDSLSDEQCQHHHRALGHALLKQPQPNLLQALQHLNQLTVETDTERQQLQQLNRQVAVQSMQQHAFDRAITYWQRLLLFSEAADHPSIQLMLAKCQLRAHQLKSCQETLTALEPQSDHQRAQRAQLQAAVLQQQGQAELALPLLCEALALLDHPLPDQNSSALKLLLQRLDQIEQQLNAGALTQLTALKETGIEQVLQLCEQVTLLAQQQGQPLLAACAITRMTELSLQHGYSDLTPFAFVSYAWVASWFCADEPLAQQLSTEGLILADRYHHQHSEYPIAATAHLIQGAQVAHWFSPVKESRQQLELARTLSERARQPIIAAQAQLIDLNLAWLGGTPLSKLSDQLQSLVDDPHHQQLKGSVGLLISQLHEGTGHLSSQYQHGWQAVASLSCALLMGQQDLWPSLYQWEALLENELPGSYGISEALFCTGMMRLIEAQPQGKLARRRLLEVARIESRLEHWARHSPSNFNTRLAIIRAEQARLNSANAAAAFEQAVRYAEQYDVLHHQAFCLERYADYLLSQQQIRLARFCLHEAQQLYQRWGADFKAKQLARLIAKLAE